MEYINQEGGDEADHVDEEDALLPSRFCVRGECVEGEGMQRIGDQVAYGEGSEQERLQCINLRFIGIIYYTLPFIGTAEREDHDGDGDSKEHIDHDVGEVLSHGVIVIKEVRQQTE